MNLGTSSSSNNNFDIDMEAILKLKSAMDKLKKNGNPRAKLLNDLKPFLAASKKEKIDQYIKMDNMLELLPLLGGNIDTRLYSDDKVLLFSLISLLF